MADANQQQPAVPAAPTPVVRAARTPAQYMISQPLDFTQRNDITIFKNGCAPLDSNKYD
jgi:hypothetical protein